MVWWPYWIENKNIKNLFLHNHLTNDVKLHTYDQLATRNIHPLGPYSVESVGAAEAVSWANGHNPGQVAILTKDARMAQSSQQAVTHFGDLGRMTD